MNIALTPKVFVFVRVCILAYVYTRSRLRSPRVYTCTRVRDPCVCMACGYSCLSFYRIIDYILTACPLQDCEDKWSDAKQKCLFRFQAFYGLSLFRARALSLSRSWSPSSGLCLRPVTLAHARLLRLCNVNIQWCDNLSSSPSLSLPPSPSLCLSGQGLCVDGIHGSVRLEFSVGAAKVIACLRFCVR